MSSVMNVSALPPPVPVAPPAPKAHAAAPTSTPATAQTAAAAATQQLTLTQLMEEPLFELKQQAQAGNQLAMQLLAQQQASNPPTAGTAQGYGSINLLA